MSKIIAIAAALAALYGCSSTPSRESIAADDRLCNEARMQAKRGDPAWSATLDRMQSLHKASYCQSYLMALDRGEVPNAP